MKRKIQRLLYAKTVAPIGDNLLWLITFPFTSPVSSGSDKIDVLTACLSFAGLIPSLLKNPFKIIIDAITPITIRTEYDM